MDFETKLNKELPWSQKFREESCHQHTSYHDEMGVPVTSGRITYKVLHADYCWEDGRVIVNSRKLISLNNRLIENEKDIVMYNMVHNAQRLLNRLGGPAAYLYKNDRITDTHYYLNDERINPGAYWLSITKQSNIYKQKKRGNVFYFKSKFKDIPCPYSYSPRYQRFIWKLNGKKVTISEFWKNWEQRFVCLPE